MSSLYQSTLTSAFAHQQESVPIVVRPKSVTARQVEYHFHKYFFPVYPESPVSPHHSHTSYTF